jgi:drug/metabolite transporter (DMT)-like permease
LQFVNQFSFLLFAFVFALAAFFLLLRGKGSRAKQIAAVLILAIVVGVFFLARPGSMKASTQQAETALLETERPVLVEIYSKY